jgi:hypothetical protein
MLDFNGNSLSPLWQKAYVLKASLLLCIFYTVPSTSSLCVYLCLPSLYDVSLCLYFVTVLRDSPMYILHPLHATGPGHDPQVIFLLLQCSSRNEWVAKHVISGVLLLPAQWFVHPSLPDVSRKIIGSKRLRNFTLLHSASIVLQVHSNAVCLSWAVVQDVIFYYYFLKVLFKWHVVILDSR